MGGAAQIRDPVIEEVIRLRFQRVAADGDDGVGQFGVLVAIVQLADAHVARRMHLRIIGRAIVDADVLHLHGAEIELADAPGVLIAAARAAMVEGRDEQPLLALVLDDRRRDASHEIERVVPARRHRTVEVPGQKKP
jgi:hypothetical protein